MSIEEPSRQHSPYVEGLMLKRQLIHLSANIIDSHGLLHEGGKDPFIEARWEDPDSENRFDLQARAKLALLTKKQIITYDLKQYNPREHMASQWYKYGENIAAVGMYDNDGKSLARSEEDACKERIVEYLRTAQRVITPEEDDIFLDVVVQETLSHAGLQDKARRLGRQAVRGGGRRGMNRIIKKLTAYQPLLNERVILASIERHLNEQS